MGTQGTQGSPNRTGAVRPLTLGPNTDVTTQPPKEDLNYKPVQTMLEIVSLGKEMQRN